MMLPDINLTFDKMSLKLRAIDATGATGATPRERTASTVPNVEFTQIRGYQENEPTTGDWRELGQPSLLKFRCASSYTGLN